ncbi:MAG: T9SS type A sorting domain-containing protein [bacterium]
MGSSPQVVDWNSDGRRDMVSGDRNGYFNVFIETGSGLEAHYKMLLLNGDTINVGNNSQPAVADWDCDGRKDLLLGSQDGYIRLYLNQTTDTWPMFQDYSYIKCGGVSINQYRINPYVVDLDQDGKRDLVCGAQDGYLHFYQNVGSDTSPTFATKETLRTTTGTLIQPSGTYRVGSRCGFCDWNNDGALDFLISGYDGYIEVYLGEAVGVEERPVKLIPVNFAISPNPAHSSINISYHLDRAVNGSLTIYDATGRQIALLESGKLTEGSHSLNWEARVQAGVYLCNLNVGAKTFTKKFILTD